MGKLLPQSVLDRLEESGFHVLEIPPYYGDSYALIPEEELEDPDDFDLNKLEQYDGLTIERI